MAQGLQIGGTRLDRRLTGRRRSAKSAIGGGDPFPRLILPKYDKVVGLLAKIQNLRHGILVRLTAAFGTYLGGKRDERYRIRRDLPGRS
jgi:hypothetical protein